MLNLGYLNQINKKVAAKLSILKGLVCLKNLIEWNLLYITYEISHKYRNIWEYKDYLQRKLSLVRLMYFFLRKKTKFRLLYKK